MGRIFLFLGILFSSHFVLAQDSVPHDEALAVEAVGGEVHFTIRHYDERLEDSEGHWNTPDTAVYAKVGDRLVITNHDEVDHVLHTSEKTPCPHGSLSEPMQPGESWSCILTTPFNAMEADELSMTKSHHDYSQHFYIVVTE